MLTLHVKSRKPVEQAITIVSAALDGMTKWSPDVLITAIGTSQGCLRNRVKLLMQEDLAWLQFTADERLVDSILDVHYGDGPCEDTDLMIGYLNRLVPAAEILYAN